MEPDISPTPAPGASAVCYECETAITEPAAIVRGRPLCGTCLEEYFAPCAGCGVFVPKDEAVIRDGVVRCGECATKAAVPDGARVPADDELRTLVDEYVALHAEKTRVDERMEEIKELLKAAAYTRERVAGAVTLKSDNASVKCSFPSRLKADQERVAALESVLGADRFAALFERKVTFNPNKTAVEAVLAGKTDDDEDVRQAVRGAVEVTETPTVTVPKGKK
jgi:hypothetical protein